MAESRPVVAPFELWLFLTVFSQLPNQMTGSHLVFKETPSVGIQQQ